MDDHPTWAPASNDPKLKLAVKYLPYLGTAKYSAEDIQKEFFNVGLNFDVIRGRPIASTSRSTGLDENLEKGVQPLEHLLANATRRPRRRWPNW